MSGRSTVSYNRILAAGSTTQILKCELIRRGRRLAPADTDLALTIARPDLPTIGGGLGLIRRWKS